MATERTTTERTHRRERLRLVLAGAAAAALAASLTAITALPARAHWDYYASMDGAGMVPPTSSPGQGTFHGKFPGHTQCPDPAGELILSISVDDLGGVPTAASLWVGADGTEGELFARFPVDAAGVSFTRDECWELDGSMYVVIETDRYPAGEIRGHIHMEVSAPVEDRSWGAIKHVYR